MPAPQMIQPYGVQYIPQSQPQPQPPPNAYVPPQPQPNAYVPMQQGGHTNMGDYDVFKNQQPQPIERKAELESPLHAAP
jgi:hypothetical protein